MAYWAEDGKFLLDDGRQTVTALLRIQQRLKLQDANAANQGDGLPGLLSLSTSLMETIQQGLLCSIVEYHDGNDDRAARVMWQVGCHDEESNKYKPTTLQQKVLVVKTILASCSGQWDEIGP